MPERYVVALIGLAVLCSVLFPFLGLYAPQRGVSLFNEVRRLVNAWLLLASLWFAFMFLSKLGGRILAGLVGVLDRLRLRDTPRLPPRPAARPAGVAPARLQPAAHRDRRRRRAGARDRAAPAADSLERIRRPQLLRRRPRVARPGVRGRRRCRVRLGATRGGSGNGPARPGVDRAAAAAPNAASRS